MGLVMDTHFGMPEQAFHGKVKMLSRTPVKRYLEQKIMRKAKSKLFIWDMDMLAETTTVLDTDLVEWEVML